MYEGFSRGKGGQPYNGLPSTLSIAGVDRGSFHTGWISLGKKQIAQPDSNAIEQNDISHFSSLMEGFGKLEWLLDGMPVRWSGGTVEHNALTHVFIASSGGCN